jgi:hypothetical protein
MTEDPIKDGSNWYVYCADNPVKYIDPWGLAVTEWDKANLTPSQIMQLENLTNQWTNAQSQAERDRIHAQANAIRQSAATDTGVTFNADGTPNILNSSKLPNTGEPNSTGILYNPDGTPKQKREYGPDGKPLKDTDYNHGGKHSFPHGHPWKDGDRGPGVPSPMENSMTSNSHSGAKVMATCLIVVGIAGTIILVLDDATLIGIADDPAIAVTGGIIVKGLEMLTY